MTLFQLVPYIRVLFLSICWGTVGGAYFPNFGFVGCYLYDGYMKIFSNFILTEVNVSNGSKPELILCFKECMNNHTYAGLKPTPNDDNYYQCFCGDDYNQTFAVDEAMCTHKNHTLMKIYNTDYDIKPLLSVPGNQTNIFEIWNATKRYKALFVNDVMRNPAIDWWKDKRLYHTPEYVKVSAMNKHGQELWAIEFFTNESSAELIDWLNPENTLNRTISNSTNIFVDMGQIAIQSKQEQNEYYFLHGLIEKIGSRVTVVTKDGNPKSDQIYGMAEAVLPKIHLEKEKRTTLKKPIWKKDLKTGARYICGLEVQEAIKITTKHKQDNKNNTKELDLKYTHFLDSCVLASAVEVDCNSTEICLCKCSNEFYANRGFVECPTGTCAWMKINGIELNPVSQYCCWIAFFKKCVLTIKKITDVTDEIAIKAELYNISAIKMDTSLLAIIPQGNEDVYIYTIKDDALLLADRVVVLGYYHKEEPKVSKWEFLNDFSIEEIQNIMRPVLQKVQSQGSVPVRNLSSSVRKKESATDMRMSSQGIGILGGSLLGLVFLIIFVSDPTCCAFSCYPKMSQKLV